jgi:hypothetical protein
MSSAIMALYFFKKVDGFEKQGEAQQRKNDHKNCIHFCSGFIVI